MACQSANPVQDSARYRLPLCMLILGALAVSFAPIFPKMAMNVSTVEPIATAFWRTSLAFPILGFAWIFARLLRRETPPRQPRKSMSSAWLLLPGLIFGLDLLTWHMSFEYTTAANATLLANLEVVLVGLVSWLVLKEHLRWPFAAGAALGLGGVALLMWAGPKNPGGTSPVAGALRGYGRFWGGTPSIILSIILSIVLSIVSPCWGVACGSAPRAGQPQCRAGGVRKLYF